VALVDMLFGSSAMMLNLAPTSGLMDLARHLREADLEMLRTTSVQHASGVDVFVAHAEPRFLDYASGTEELSTGVCAVLRNGYISNASPANRQTCWSNSRCC
jgi:hypothetical protein